MIHDRISFACKAAGLLLPLLNVCNAQEWTRFRGPNGSGISQATTIPTSWTDHDYRWKVELPGVGHGSPVIWGERLFVNCADESGKARILQCRSTRDGSLLWEQSFEAAAHKHHKFNSYATSTPCVDEKHVYISWGNADELVVLALTHDGAVVWRNDKLGAVFGGHGFGTSPIVVGERVILANDTEKESALFALNRMTGEIDWKVPRPGGRLNFSTPCIYSSPEHADQAIFVAWPIGVTAVNVESGNIAWERPCFDASKGQRAVGSPIVAGELVLATSAFTNNPKHLVALKPTESSATEVFRVDKSTVPHIPSLLVHDGLLYAWADKGIATCYELSSGDQIWQKRIGGNFFSSPVCVNGNIYSINADGEMVVIRAGRQFEELARIDLGEPTRATPAVANGRMYIRTFSHLMAIGTD